MPEFRLINGLAYPLILEKCVCGRGHKLFKISICADCLREKRESMEPKSTFRTFKEIIIDERGGLVCRCGNKLDYPNVISICKDCLVEKDRKEKIKTIEASKRLLDYRKSNKGRMRFYRDIGIQEEYYHCTLKNFDESIPSIDCTKESVHNAFKQGKNLILFSQKMKKTSGVGTGKTHIACSVLYQRYLTNLKYDGTDTIFIDAAIWSRDFERKFPNDKGDAMWEFMKYYKYIIDDIGKESDHKVMSEVLTELHANKKRFILTMNLDSAFRSRKQSEQDLANYFVETYGVHIWSRISNMCTTVLFIGGDVRGN